MNLVWENIDQGKEIDLKDYQKLFKEILEIIDTILNCKENESCRCSDIWLKDKLIAIWNGGLWERYLGMDKWGIPTISEITIKILKNEL